MKRREKLSTQTKDTEIHFAWVEVLGDRWKPNPMVTMELDMIARESDEEEQSGQQRKTDSACSEKKMSFLMDGQKLNILLVKASDHTQLWPERI